MFLINLLLMLLLSSICFQSSVDAQVPLECKTAKKAMTCKAGDTACVYHISAGSVDQIKCTNSSECKAGPADDVTCDYVKCCCVPGPKKCYETDSKVKELFCKKNPNFCKAKDGAAVPFGSWGGVIGCAILSAAVSLYT